MTVQTAINMIRAQNRNSPASQFVTLFIMRKRCEGRGEVRAIVVMISRVGVSASGTFGCFKCYAPNCPDIIAFHPPIRYGL